MAISRGASPDPIGIEPLGRRLDFDIAFCELDRVNDLNSTGSWKIMPPIFSSSNPENRGRQVILDACLDACATRTYRRMGYGIGGLFHLSRKRDGDVFVKVLNGSIFHEEITI
tara:strand:+ start:98 stop:436 length:339 start_codon:yes stop_codon:yes gene_type:complete